MTIDETVIDGVAYYSAVAVDGWPTGPCPTPDEARGRCRAYERGEEVSEAAPGQLSRAQMTTLREWLEAQDLLGLAMIDAARRDGLHSNSWVHATALCVRLVGDGRIPAELINLAGGARIRRAASETFLSRSAR